MYEIRLIYLKKKTSAKSDEEEEQNFHSFVCKAARYIRYVLVSKQLGGTERDLEHQIEGLRKLYTNKVDGTQNENFLKEVASIEERAKELRENAENLILELYLTVNRA